MAVQRVWRIDGSRGRLLTRAVGVVVLTTGLVACRLVGVGADTPIAAGTAEVAAVAGWTRIATTENYILVVNVLPGERMYSKGEAGATHPIVGELCIIGAGQPVGPDVRHVEAHIYDRVTGLPVADVKPAIVIVNRTTGERTSVPPTLMQDLIVGSMDIHWGNNVKVTGNSDLSVIVTLAHEEVTVDGHLD